MKPNTDTNFTEKADYNKIERNWTFGKAEFRFKAEKNNVCIIHLYNEYKNLEMTIIKSCQKTTTFAGQQPLNSSQN